MNNNNNDLMSAVMDEISLEGLDGITLDSLWIRLRVRFTAIDNSFDFMSSSVQNFIFDHLIQSLTNDKLISMYLLPEKRPSITLFNRYDYINEETGTLIEDSELIPDDVYGEVIPISDQQIRGSSRDYYLRKNVTKDVLNNKMSINDIKEVFDSEKFVLVANQCQRTMALMGPYSDPDIDLTPIQYCILERIGRQRFLGEITIGKESGNYKLTPKTLFYYRKILLRKKLIKKKQCILYNVRTVQNSHGLVFTLTRFATETQTITEINAKKINDLLLESENNELNYEEVKTRLDIKARHLRELLANYSTNFRVCDSGKDGNSSANKRTIRLTKAIDEDLDEEDIEEDEEEVTIGGSKSQSLAVFNPGKILVDRPLLSQALTIIESHESHEGISLREVGQCLSLPKLESRSLVRYLEKAGDISPVMVDRGRQKVTLYLPKCRANDAKNMFSRARKALAINEVGQTTVNLLNRANIILEFVQKEQLVDRIFALKELIRDSEKNNLHKCCTKTVVRIVHKLAADGLVRSIRTILRYQEQVKKLHFVCIPSITPDHPLVKERINQIKFQWIGKYCIDIKSDKQLSYNSPQKNSTEKSTKSENMGKNNVVMNLIYQPSIARRYGLEPKMKKMLTLYKFLFYLTYDFDKQNIPNTDWRYNIEALPEGERTKVCTIGEIIPRLPLSIFVKIIWISYIIPGLQELIDDPIAINLTLSQISTNIRQCLLYKRKFAFNICEALVGLSYMGLVETQSKEQTEKEKTIITVKNKFTLIANNIQKDYEFVTIKELEEFVESLQMHCFEPCNDCSLDKRLFAHNLRNWTYTPAYKVKNVFASNRLQSLSGNNETIESIVDKENVNKKGNKKRKRTSNVKNYKKAKTSESTTSATIPPTLSTTGLKRIRMRSYDKIDLRAKSFLKKQRTDWTPEEDGFLLICKVVSALLDPLCTNHICVNRNVIRDELHKYYPEVSKDKTALACQRRITYMLKNPNTRQNVSDYIGEFNQDLTVSRPDVPKTQERVWTEAYVSLLTNILNRMQNLTTNSSQTLIEVKSMDELLKRYRIVNTREHLLPIRGPMHEDPNNVVDIHVNVVTNVLLSSLLNKHYLNVTKSEGNLFVQTLFRIYQRYPDSLIRSVVTKLGKYGIMTKVKKTVDLSTIKSKGSTPYRISQNFLFLLQTKYYLESLLNDSKLEEDLIIKEGKTGFDAAIVSTLLTSKCARFYTHIPDNIVVLQNDCPLYKTVRNSVKNPKDPKNSSRYALYLLRQHMNSNASDRTQHSADYLLVNQCRITCCSADQFVLDLNNFENLFKTHKQVFTEELKACPIGRLSADDKYLLDWIKSKKELGASEEELLTMRSKESLLKSLKRFSEQKMAFRAGIRNFRWVSVQYINPWLVHSYVNPETVQKSSKNDKNCIKFFARYWKQPNGTVDNKVLFKFLSAVLGHIMSNPCIPQQKLIEYFNQSLQPIQLLEVIELLSAVQCVDAFDSLQISKPKLFEPKIYSSDIKIRHYISTPDCIIRLSRLKDYLKL